MNFLFSSISIQHAVKQSSTKQTHMRNRNCAFGSEIKDIWKKSVINDDDCSVILRIPKTGQIEHLAEMPDAFGSFVFDIPVVDVIPTAPHSPPPTRPPYN